MYGKNCLLAKRREKPIRTIARSKITEGTEGNVIDDHAELRKKPVEINSKFGI